DPDALGSERRGDRAHEADDARLGRGVRGAPVAAEGGDGRDADDGAAAALRQGGRRGAGRQEHGLEVDGQHLVPLVLLRVQQILARLDPDVVVEDVETSPAPRGRGHHRRAVRGARHIRGDRLGLMAFATDDPDRLLGALADPVHAEHARALGRHWQARTPAERDEFVGLFGDLLERAYITKIEGYTGERILFTGEVADGAFATVRTRIVTKQGTEVPVDYKMFNQGERWRAYDVNIEGVSLVSNYRTQFSSII